MSRFYRIDSPESSLICFHCPGCGYGHAVRIKGSEPVWQWNGDLNKPTFSPSLLVNGTWAEKRCHSFIRDGKIQFLGDCFHHLKGQTVEPPEDP